MLGPLYELEYQTHHMRKDITLGMNKLMLRKSCFELYIFHMRTKLTDCFKPLASSVLHDLALDSAIQEVQKLVIPC